MPHSSTPTFTVDADCPAGNIIVNEIAGDLVSVHQDIRDTTTDWFYWRFRVCNAQGRTLRFRFTGSDVFSAMGPAISRDRGRTWRWLGIEDLHDQTFPFSFGPDEDEVHFAVAPAYLQSHLDEFLVRHGANPHLAKSVLCHTKKGRAVEKLRLGNITGSPDHRILVVSRHHACESIATCALEGLMEGILNDKEHGSWLREHVEFMVVPFMDKDGVEEGDQGKNRAPHDHWRDYNATSLYPSVQALRDQVPAWAGDRLRFALDMHCPHLNRNSNRMIHFAGEADAVSWANVVKLSNILARVRQGPFVFDPKDDLPHGEGWNVYPGPLTNYAQWARSLPGVLGSVTYEIPYAIANGEVINGERAKLLGHDLARAFAIFLQEVAG